MPRYTLGGAPNPDPYFEPEDAEALIEWELDTESMATHSEPRDADEAEDVFKEAHPMPLPDCMMPDGADPCKGYSRLREALTDAIALIEQLRPARHSLAEARLAAIRAALANN